jgi:hypothetical protein
MKSTERSLRSIRRLLLLFIAGLLISGITAFPIETLLETGVGIVESFLAEGEVATWLTRVYEGVRETNAHYPFIAYGTDWLAFAHIVIAIAFVGPLRDPVRNVWVIEFGLIACASIFPLALIAGSARGIPFFWQCIDCSFGIVGGILLWIIYRKIKTLELRRLSVSP